ncbi:hypothetical protein [Acidovorax carolinensis]|uniref:hypothetical protein n=1 Tax=Acidovorax carolinensis TaxID=553814 RepID=UPI001F3E822D|nr:hypothetical protein [Acidovorax carolinensis]
MSGQQRRRRIVHVVDSFAVGGLENVIVQPINRLLAERFEHVVLSLTIMSDFKQCITQPDVRFIELHKPAGHAAALFRTSTNCCENFNPMWCTVATWLG